MSANGVTPVEVRGFIAALMATGASRWEAVGIAAAAFGIEAVQGRWSAHLARVRHQNRSLDVLGEVAIGSPAIANLWLAEALVAGKILPLDEGGHLLRLTEPWIQSVPPIRLQADLELGAGFRRLPDGLHVAGHLWLNRCALWDGVIPAGTRIDGFLNTPQHPDGISLFKWRRAHPTGNERA